MTRFPPFVIVGVAVGALVVAPGALAGPRASTLVSTVTVTAGKPSEFKYTVTPSVVKRGIIAFKFTNKGALPHDFKWCSRRSSSLANSCTGRGTRAISPGQTTTLRVVVLLKGTYEYLCTIPGHAAAGMKGLLNVT
jgi:plastocyanin